jgi:predicted Zn-dependent protease
MRKKWTLLIGVGIVIGLICLGYFKSRQINPATGKRQFVNLSPEEEVVLAINAAPELVKQLGGLSENRVLRDSVKSVGQRLVHMSTRDLRPYAIDFHLLADPQACHVLSLPGGQVFITIGLLKRLQSVNQLAAVLSHEMGHIVARQATEKLATQGLFKGVIGPGGAGAGNDPDAGMRAYVAAVAGLTYDNRDELVCDQLAMRFMADAGYDPEALIAGVQLLNRDITPFAKMHVRDENYVGNLRDALQRFRND